MQSTTRRMIEGTHDRQRKEEKYDLGMYYLQYMIILPTLDIIASHEESGNKSELKGKVSKELIWTTKIM
jgi:hypothetical protein